MKLTRLEASFLQPRGCPADRIAKLRKTPMRLHLVREHYRQVREGWNACACEGKPVSD